MQRLQMAMVVLLLVPCVVHGQSEEATFDFGNINFSLSPKIMMDGSVTDVALGIMYNSRFSGDFRYRNTTISRNEEIPGFHDSLNARDEKIHNVFMLPVGYRYTSFNTVFWIGGGLYYEHDKLKEKGFFDSPDWEELGFDRVNAYTNDFSMHVLGPLLDVKLNYTADFFNISLQGGLVPVFFLSAKEQFGIIPLLGPNTVAHSQKTGGSPYLYLGLDTTVFKYVNLCLNYHFSRIRYETISYDFDVHNNVTWEFPQTTVIGHTINMAISALIPLGNDFRFQIGYGFGVNTLIIDSRDITDNNHYLILGTKKLATKK